MNEYEGMFIFPESLNDEALEAAVGRVRAEIERAGGAVESATRLGKRVFARPLARRHTSGHYVVINFKSAGNQIAPLRERLKLGGEVFRFQFVRRGAPAPVVEAADGTPQ